MIATAFALSATGAIDQGAEEPAIAFLTTLSRGTLVICGGGEISDDVLHDFAAAAGGPAARIVVVTTASDTADTEEIDEDLEFWRSLSINRLSILHTRSRETANDRDFARPLAEATGVWFIGGKQAHLADTYLGTLCESLIHEVLARGGVVGGTSAGAAIMSSVMIRQGDRTPETGRGFGLLPGTLIDQHFLTRNRQRRLIDALAGHPGLVGLGIDEGTAIVVHGRNIRVVGDSDVVACVATTSGNPPRMATLKPGTQTDLLALCRAAGRPGRALAKPDVSVPADCTSD